MNREQTARLWPDSWQVILDPAPYSVSESDRAAKSQFARPKYVTSERGVCSISSNR